MRISCKLLRLSTSVYYYRCKPTDDKELIELLDQLAESHPTYGFRKLFKMIRKQGYVYNHKRVYRIYRQMGLNIRRKRKRRIPERVKEPLTLPINTNIMWSIDFMQDSFLNGKSFRTLNIIDDFNLECLWITADVSIASARVTRELDKLIHYRGKPLEIRVDNGTEFTSMHF